MARKTFLPIGTWVRVHQKVVMGYDEVGRRRTQRVALALPQVGQVCGLRHKREGTWCEPVPRYGGMWDEEPHGYPDQPYLRDVKVVTLYEVRMAMAAVPLLVFGDDLLPCEAPTRGLPYAPKVDCSWAVDEHYRQMMREEAARMKRDARGRFLPVESLTAEKAA